MLKQQMDETVHRVEPKGDTPRGGETAPSDVVILVNLPRALYTPDQRGFLDASREGHDRYLAYLATCPFVMTLIEKGVPVEVSMRL